MNVRTLMMAIFHNNSMTLGACAALCFSGVGPVLLAGAAVL
jgi:hypothetical protein